MCSFYPLPENHFPRSILELRLSDFSPADYGPVFVAWLDRNRCRPLDDSQPQEGGHQGLPELSIETAFTNSPLADQKMAECCLAGVWLLHDCLEQSHTVSQNIPTDSGSFWHGIMHRREGDFSNAKYWFRRVGKHAVFEPLAEQVIEIRQQLGQTSGAVELLCSAPWDPFAFVDCCRSAVRGENDAQVLCGRIQQAEWELLFDHCYRSATAT